jgi:hypothetical protein
VFANVHYIGPYRDSLIAGNRVGLYAGSITPFSDFTDFAIYPVPSTFMPWL